MQGEIDTVFFEVKHSSIKMHNVKTETGQAQNKSDSKSFMRKGLAAGWSNAVAAAVAVGVAAPSYPSLARLRGWVELLVTSAFLFGLG